MEEGEKGLGCKLLVVIWIINLILRYVLFKDDLI